MFDRIEDKEIDKEIDKELNIQTTGLIEWPRGVNLDYFRTESSSYRDLKRFVEKYDLREDSHLVDYGSGKGRIVFYLNHQLNIPTTGIEVNKKAFALLEENHKDYEKEFPEKASTIQLVEKKAEVYSVKPTDDIFYFFNPFTVNIFGEVIQKIEASLKEHPRVADIILYYPGVAYAFYLEKYSSFHLVQTIKTPRYFLNNRECFKVFRYYPT